MAVAARQFDDDDGGESFGDELKPGARLLLGQFTIDAFLNAGGFGITYLARDSLDRRVVVKECFPGSFCRRTEGIVAARSRQRQDEFRSIVELFMQEALNLSKLDHPNIVKVHQVFQDNQTAYMAMDFIEGPDLLETVEGTAPKLTPDQIMLALHRMLDALAYVHAQGFLHRDISPDNILLNRSTGEPVLIDFGAARKDVTRKSRALSGLRVVKDGYSPQEFYITGSKQAPCSDLYALAATFCHLVSGEVPKTSQERLAAIANREGDPQRPLVGRVKGYPRSFLAAIDQAMSIFPKDRLQSATEWLALLQADAPHAATVPVAVPAPTFAANLVEPPARAVPVEAPAAPRRTLRESLVTAAAAVVIVAGLGAIGGQLVDRLGATPIASAVTPASGLSRTVRLPFQPNPADGGLVAAPLPWSPDWVTPGLRIVEVNGAPLQPGASLPALLSGSADLAALTEVTVILGYELTPGADIVRKRETLPVVDQLRVEAGLVFDIVDSPTGPRTVVSAVPDGAATDLKVGDVLLAYAPTGETLGTSTALADILKREAENGVATYGFAVQRDGGVTVGSFISPGAG